MYYIQLQSHCQRYRYYWYYLQSYLKFSQLKADTMLHTSSFDNLLNGVCKWIVQRLGPTIWLRLSILLVHHDLKSTAFTLMFWMSIIKKDVVFKRSESHYWPIVFLQFAYRVISNVYNKTDNPNIYITYWVMCYRLVLHYGKTRERYLPNSFHLV